MYEIPFCNIITQKSINEYGKLDDLSLVHFNYIILTDLIVKREYTLTYQIKVLVYIPNTSI